MTSVGCRSGVHWMRPVVAPTIVRAKDAGEDGLRGAGNVLEQYVPATRHRREDELDLVGLAVDDRLDVRDEVGGSVRRTIEIRRAVEWHGLEAHRVSIGGLHQS